MHTILTAKKGAKATKPAVSAGAASGGSGIEMKMKLKTHRGAAKRFKKTATGKFKRGSAFKRHILTSKIDEAEAQPAQDHAGLGPGPGEARADAALQIGQKGG